MRLCVGEFANPWRLSGRISVHDGDKCRALDTLLAKDRASVLIDRFASASCRTMSVSVNSTSGIEGSF